MSVQEPLLESRNMKEDELEETLSLCDLPLYSDQSADWDDQYFSLNSTSNSTSSCSHQDYFEFFTQELHPSAASAAAFFPPENIVFCGKLIPYKQLSPCKADASPNQADDDQMIKNKNKKTSRWRRWRLTFAKNSKVSKNGNKGTTAIMHQPHRKMYNPGKQLGRANNKWYFFLFGISRFSPVVELSDIRRRQCRSPPSSSPPPPPMMFGLRNGGDDKVVSDRGWGLWGLIRALSCGGGQLPTAVAAVAAGG